MPISANTASNENRTGAFNKNKERFAAFLRNTDQKEVQLRATLDGLKENAPRAWAAILDQERNFKILAVGAGNGGLEIPLLKSIIGIRGSEKNISLFCEDVSKTMHEEFLQNIDKADLTALVEEYQVVPFEAETYIPQPAHFVISSHVWYYVQNWRNTAKEKNTLEKFRRALIPEGIGLITVYSESSDRYILIQHLHMLLAKEAPELPGERIAAELDALGISNKTEIVDAHTNVSACYQNKKFDPTEEGALLLSFILRTDWDLLSAPAKAGVGQKLDEIILKNGKSEMVFSDLYVWINP